ncbi:hypothetical protein ACJIZ3_001669 [Penstemon smallii]|uniref:C2 NT-type domain-containing protein n=1 Tax=Penstemon smallii TaxID=265156 RepID=A0ABD3U499_9LAMI
MTTEIESIMEDDEDLSSGHFLRDIEEISKALYLGHKSPRAFNISPNHNPNVASRTSISESKSKFIIQDSSHKDKKSSIWNWKPLKALTHIRNHRLNCCFYLHVHAIEGLPSNFNNLNLRVTCKRKGDMLRTRPSPVSLGICDFEETLVHRCTVYASRTGTQNLAKYEPKLFLLHTNVIEAPTLDIGKHCVDLTRLLPLTLEELEGGKRSSARWTTSFNLTGRAKGAILNLSFGFSIMNGKPDSFGKFPDVVGVGGPHNLGTVPTISTQGSHSRPHSVDINLIDEVFANRKPAPAPSINSLYRKLEEGNMDNDRDFDFFRDPFESLKLKTDPLHEYGVELFVKDQVRIDKHGSQRFDSSLIETIDVAEIFKEEELDFDGIVECESELDKNEHDENENATDDTESKPGSYINEPTVEELELVSYEILTLKSTELDSLPGISKYYNQEIHPETDSSYYISKLKRSLSLDDIAIENDFLNMLSIEQSSESPNDHLLTQFEEGTVSWENPILDTDLMAEQKESHSDDIDLSIAIQAVNKNHGGLTQSIIMSKRNAEMLENLETESLMQEWGLNENAFQNSPHVNSGGFGSPVYIPAEEPLKLPTLGEDLGPIIRTRDGGFLRSMNPLLFVRANNGARLIVQVSAAVVLPPEMGFTTMEILQCWATGGVEKMSIQVKELMHLEDITGKTIKQVVSEAQSKAEVDKSTYSLYSCSGSEDTESEYISFENLVPMAITNIEGLLIEGLKVQSGMPVQEAPSSIKVQYSDVEELVKYSVSLEEWMRLDSGEFDAKDETDENIRKVFAVRYLIKEDETDKRCGVFGDNFTMALQVQLRDPLRNFEIVGSSMLALVQVEKVYSEKIFNVRKDSNGKGFPQFKVMEVHLAGLNVLSSNQQLWGTSRQQQSGSRWLLSSGMARANKHCISNSNAIVKSSSSGITRKAWNGDVLWSICSHIRGETATWDDRVAFNVHVRNPDIIFPNES